MTGSEMTLDQAVEELGYFLVGHFATVEIHENACNQVVLKAQDPAKRKRGTEPRVMVAANLKEALLKWARENGTGGKQRTPGTKTYCWTPAPGRDSTHPHRSCTLEPGHEGPHQTTDGLCWPDKIPAGLTAQDLKIPGPIPVDPKHPVGLHVHALYVRIHELETRVAELEVQVSALQAAALKCDECGKPAPTVHPGEQFHVKCGACTFGEGS